MRRRYCRLVPPPPCQLAPSDVMPPPQESPTATIYAREDEYYYTGVDRTGGDQSLPPDRILLAA